MKKLCFYILIFSFLNYVGCYSSRSASKDILYTKDLGEPSGVVTIIIKDDKKLVVDEGIYELVGDTLHITGLKLHTNFVEQIDLKIALDDIQYVEIEEIDNFATTGCVIGLATLAIFIVLAITAANSFDNSPKKCSGPEGFGFEEGKD
ncbi:hypothetical protein ACFLQ4_02190 [Bacteroidota bacterium]